MTTHPKNSADRFRLLISAEQLQALQQTDQPLMVFDCSFDLAAPEAGHQAFVAGHIPGAIYAHMDAHLSAKGQPDAASGGRHPLPAREKFTAWLGSAGLDQGAQVVVYDRQGANYCGRLWWMLQWVGHDAVAVLDGGWPAWLAAAGAVASGEATQRLPTNYAVAPELSSLVAIETIAARLGVGGQTVIDARAAARFRGETEPLDPVAGHIPGALNRPFANNFQSNGHFKPAAQLRVEFEALLGSRDPARVVHHCGSGITAVPNLIAMRLAGLYGSKLFAGSWSEWCSDPNRPVAKG